MKRKPAVPKSNSTKPAAEYVFQPNIKFAFICAVLAFVLYANSIWNLYALDDVVIIKWNQYVGQGFKGIPALFSIDVWHFGNVNLGYYRPLSLVTFAIENQFFPMNPHVSHLGNVVLYAITGFFLCLLLMRIFKTYHPLFSLLITLVFMAHPIHTEVVANIKSRDEILSFLNLIIALYIFVVKVKSEKINFKWLGLSCFFFYLALLSKETAMVGFILIPLILFFTTLLSPQKTLLSSLPFIGVFLIFQLHKFIVLGTLSGATVNDLVNYPYQHFDAKFPSMLVIFSWCVRLVIVPYPLSYNYAFNQIPPAEWVSFGVVAGIILAGTLLFLSYRDIQKKSPLSFGILFFGITLAPAMGFVLIKGGILAERFLYAPSLGFSMALVWLLSKIFKLNLKSQQTKISSVTNNIPLTGILVLLFSLSSFQIISRNTIWHDNLSLYEHDLQVASNSCQTHLHYGLTLIETALAEKDARKKQVLFEKSIEQFRISLQIHPANPEANYGLGLAYQSSGTNLDSAIYYCKRCIELSPVFPKSYEVLALVYEVMDKQKLASYYHNKAVELNPYDTETLKNLETHKQNTGFDIHELPVDETSNPEQNAQSKEYIQHKNLGLDAGMKGDYSTALTHLEKALELNPTSAEALVNLAICYGMMNNYEMNIETLNKMLSLYPNSIIAVQNLIVTYERMGNKAKADEYRKKLNGQ